MILILTHGLQLLALAGGGGSGGGGGGGGGGSGGGGGNGFGVIAVVAGVIAYGVAHLARKQLPASIRVASWFGFATTLVLAIVTGKLSGAIGFLVGAGGAGGSFVYYFEKTTRAKRDAKIKAQLDKASAIDQVWNQQTLTEHVKQVFVAYETDWSNFNLAGIQSYTTEQYFTHMRLMLAALNQLGRRNDVQRPELTDLELQDIDDEVDNSRDSFVAHITGRAQDVLLRVADDHKLYSTGAQISEYWHFARVGNEWRLAGIRQPTEEAASAVSALRDFADQNGLFYSLDMGRLLIPERGLLFGGASFTISDINNHCIGEWQQLLVQLYTYDKNPNNTADKTYLVGQLTLPKSHGGILVRRRDQESKLKHLFGGDKPSGYQQVKLEWPDFNERYDVYATDMDKVTSFELLNPAYMVKLYDSGLPVNIEVTDNAVFFFTPLSAAGADQYAAMLGILQGAFKELRL